MPTPEHTCGATTTPVTSDGARGRRASTAHEARRSGAAHEHTAFWLMSAVEMAISMACFIVMMCDSTSSSSSSPRRLLDMPPPPRSHKTTSQVLGL